MPCRLSRVLIAIGAAIVLVVPDVASAAPPAVDRGARILTAAGKTCEPGAVLSQDGKIVAVGLVDEVRVPEGATTVDLAGKVIIPGLVDTHLHLGVSSRPTVAANLDGTEGS